MPRPLRAAPFIQYAWNKSKYDIQREQYLFDMLWVRAVGRQFTDNKTEPAYPRWGDIQNSKREEIKPTLTKETVKEQFRKLKTKT